MLNLDAAPPICYAVIPNAGSRASVLSLPLDAGDTTTHSVEILVLEPTASERLAKAEALLDQVADMVFARMTPEEAQDAKSRGEASLEALGLVPRRPE